MNEEVDDQFCQCCFRLSRKDIEAFNATDNGPINNVMAGIEIMNFIQAVQLILTLATEIQERQIRLEKKVNQNHKEILKQVMMFIFSMMIPLLIVIIVIMILTASK